MIDIIDEIDSWITAKRKFVLATVTDTWRSAPRGVGASMIIDEKGRMAGSLSGGCVEGQVVKRSVETLRSGQTQNLQFGVSNDDAWSVGLSCGGAISVYIQPFLLERDEGKQIWKIFKQYLTNDQGCVLIYHEQGVGLYGSGVSRGYLPEVIFQKANMRLNIGSSQLENIEGKMYFFHVFPPRNHLIIIGAAHISRDLITLAKFQDFRVSVIDPRGLFYDSLKDLVDQDALYRSWPADIIPDLKLDRSVYVVLLTHDPKIDDQALKLLLRSGVSYIGALGSKKTHEKRIQRLLEAEFSPEEVNRIRGPVGLDIGASKPAEIALSIMAEIIKVKNQNLMD